MKSVSLVLVVAGLLQVSAAVAEPFTNLPLIHLGEFQKGNTLYITLSDDYVPLRSRPYEGLWKPTLDKYGYQSDKDLGPRAAEFRGEDPLVCSVTQGVAGADAIALPRGTSIAVTRVLYHGNLATVSTTEATPMGIIILTEGNLFDISCMSFRSGMVSTSEGQKLTMTGIRDFTLNDLIKTFEFSQLQNKSFGSSLVGLSAVAKENKEPRLMQRSSSATSMSVQKPESRGFWKRLLRRK